MKNKEKYAKEIEEISRKRRIAIKNDKPVVCEPAVKCDQCNRNAEGRCTDKPLFDWLEEKYVPEVDWTKVPVDTKILVRASVEDDWKKRHFARYQNFKVYAFDGNGTSWSTANGVTFPWIYAKLAEPLEEKPKSAMELLANSYYADGDDDAGEIILSKISSSCPEDYGYVNMQKCDVEKSGNPVDCYKCWTLPQPPKES